MVYNERVEKTIANYHFEQQDFILVDNGRHNDEKAVVRVKNGKYKGFGFVPVEVLDRPGDGLDGYIEPRQDNKEVRRLIISALRSNKYTLIHRD